MPLPKLFRLSYVRTGYSVSFLSDARTSSMPKEKALFLQHVCAQCPMRVPRMHSNCRYQDGPPDERRSPFRGSGPPFEPGRCLLDAGECFRREVSNGVGGRRTPPHVGQGEEGGDF